MNLPRLLASAVTLGLACVAVENAVEAPKGPRVQTKAVVVVEAPREATAPAPADPAPADASVARGPAPSPAPRPAVTAPPAAPTKAPTKAPSTAPAPRAEPEGADAVTEAPAGERISRAMFVIDGPFGGVDVDCGPRTASGTRSVRMVDFPAGECRVRAHTTDGTYETRVQVDRALTVSCGMKQDALSCTRPTL